MPRYAKETDKILHPSYRRAWLFVRGDTYYTSIHSRIIETTCIQVVDKKENATLYKNNLKLAHERLNDRLMQFLRPNSKVTINQATKEFIATKKNKIADRSINQYITIFTDYLDQDLFVSETDKIRAQVLSRLAAKKADKEVKLRVNTENFHMRTLRGFFAYCVDVGLCDKNPIPEQMVPEKSEPEPKFFTHEEINIIIQHLRTGEYYRKFTKERDELILLIRLLSTAGLRIAEALKLTKQDITDDGLRIDGKRISITKPKIRFFPFFLVPQVGEICKELKTFNSGNKVFSWKNRTNPAEKLRNAMEDLEMDAEGKSLHSLRKTALNYWEKKLGLPEEIRNLLAGHTNAVKKNYYRDPTLQDTIEKIVSLKNFVGNL